jgi:hypothetical protein
MYLLARPKEDAINVLNPCPDEQPIPKHSHVRDNLVLIMSPTAAVKNV